MTRCLLSSKYWRPCQAGTVDINSPCISWHCGRQVHNFLEFFWQRLLAQWEPRSGEDLQSAFSILFPSLSFESKQVYNLETFTAQHWKRLLTGMTIWARGEASRMVRVAGRRLTAQLLWQQLVLPSAQPTHLLAQTARLPNCSCSTLFYFY